MSYEEHINVPFIVWEITNRCQMECLHCFNSYNKKRDLPHDQLIKIARELNQEGFSITISGGEPFLSSSLLEIVQCFDKIESLDVQTNGLLLKKHLDDFLDCISPKINYTSIGLPLDGGTAETHNKIRVGVSNHFQTVLECFELLQTSEKVYSYATTCFNKLNINEFDQILELLNGFGAAWVSGLMMPTGSALENMDLILNTQEISTWLIKLLNNFNPLTTYPYEIIPYPTFKSPSFFLPHSCMILNDVSFKIDTSGTCHLCCFFNSPFAQVPQDNLETVLTLRKKSEMYSKVEKIVEKSNPQCKNCQYNKVCNNCPGYQLHDLPSKYFSCPLNSLPEIRKLLDQVIEENA
ncbi:MAG: radical SAM protein [Candidatus Hodarchaeota archaeon]